MDKFISNLNKKVGKTIMEHDLIAKEDRILIALSGGKDSMITLDVLANRLKYIPFKVELVAVHILIKNIGYQTDVAYLESFCMERNVKFYLMEFEIEMKDESNKTECFICSWNRRKALFKFAEQYGCNKIAFGHHMDDAIETLFMNMMYHGTISSMPFKLKMFKGKFEIIRPLLEISEDNLKIYSKHLELKKEVKNCPFENTKRTEIKQIVKQFHSIHRIARKNIFRSMSKIDYDYLPDRS